MGNIKLLDEKLVNKIAAGEVVERPASVVKELVENAIDANATSIEVEVSAYGKKLIRVKDNGSGMSADDAKLSLMRHSTSKIKDVNDLFAIHSLGFRGEALASIAAVSCLTLITRQKNEVQGYRIEVEGGNALDSSVAGSSPGTIIEVKDLFFNTPARLKFLKSDSNELRHIVNIVMNYALLYSNISFKLSHEGHVLVDSPSNPDMLQNIASVYGAEFAKHMVKVEHEEKGVSVNGYVSKPSLLKSDKSFQSLYVNGRYVKDDTITNAIYDAYHTLLFVNRHPVVVLDIKLDVSKVDVNVHPTKDKIKIEQSSLVYDVVFSALRTALKGERVEQEVSFKQKPLFKNLGAEISGLKTQVKRKPLLLEKGRQSFFVKENVSSMASAKSYSSTNYPNTSSFAKKFTKLPEMKLIGCVNKTYFIAETNEGLMIIDQHVVWERVLYERFMKEFMDKNVKSQSLLSPKVIELSVPETIVLKDNLDKLKDIGFNVEHFGENSFRISDMPMVFGKALPDDLIKDIISEISEKKTSFESLQESIITRMACRASVKAGDYVSIPQMEKMLEELDATELPFTCPHGRPIIVKLSFSDIEKMFRRK